MKINERRALALFASTAIGAFCLPAAFAQSAPTTMGKTDTAQAEAAHVEDIVVTATRRNTSLQRTPVAVSVVTAATINRTAPADIRGLAALVPNFSASTVPGYNAASFAMRGRGQTQAQDYIEPPVAVVIDDFVNPSTQTQLLDPFDLESVQVLRGPQGTLFGKNTTAGAVIVTTKRPTLDHSEVSAELGIGSFNERIAKLAVNVPIVQDKVGLRIVGAYVKNDGYYHNRSTYGPIKATAPGATTQYNGLTGTGDGRRVGGKEVFNGRVKLLAAPTDDLDILVQYEHLIDRSDSPPNINLARPGQLFNTLGFTADVGGDPLDHAAVPNRSGFLIDLDKGQRVDMDGVYANIDWTLGIGTLSSATGYRFQKSRLPNSFTGEDPPQLTVNANQRAINRHTYQQELRLAGKILQNLDYVIGGFYQREDIDFCQAGVFGFQDLLVNAAILPPGGFNNNPKIVCNQERVRSIAGFVDMTYKATDRLSFSGGVRYTRERKRFRGRNEVFIQALPAVYDPSLTWDKLGDILNGLDFDKYPGAAGIGSVVTDAKTWTAPSYRLTASYQATDTFYTYATFAHGFKSGGYIDQVGRSGLRISDDEKKPYNQETVDSYEIGIKSDLFYRRLRFNLTGFYAKYKDLQIATARSIINVNGVQTSANVFTNATSGTAKGIEAEANLAATDRLRLNAAAGYLNSRFGSFVKSPTVDLTGEPTERAPKWQYTFDASYTLPLSELGSLQFNGTVQYEGRSTFLYSDVNRAYDVVVPAHTLVNGNITYSAPDNRYYVRFLARNIFDKRYLTSGQPVAAAWVFGGYGEPRYLGLQIGTNF